MCDLSDGSVWFEGVRRRTWKGRWGRWKYWHEGKEADMVFREWDIILLGKNEKDDIKKMIDLGKERELNSWKENEVCEEG